MSRPSVLVASHVAKRGSSAALGYIAVTLQSDNARVAKSGSERQSEYRARQRAEAARANTRTLIGLTCACCGETEASFLTRVNHNVYCRNCAEPVRLGHVCPHRGIGRKLR